MKDLKYLIYLFKKTFKEDISEFVWHIAMPAFAAFFLICIIGGNAVIYTTADIFSLFTKVFWVLCALCFILNVEALVLCKRYWREEDVVRKAVQIYAQESSKEVHTGADEAEETLNSGMKGEYDDK